MNKRNESIAFGAGLGVGMITISMVTESLNYFWISLGWLISVGLVSWFGYTKQDKGVIKE